VTDHDTNLDKLEDGIEARLTQAQGNAAYATAAQGALASTAIQPGNAALSDAREWTAATIEQAEAEAGTATTRRAFTAQRVFQAVAAWWAASAAATKLAGIGTGATANSSDATLLARANHTGTQAAGTITGLAAVATSGAYSSLSGLPTLPTGTNTGDQSIANTSDSTSHTVTLSASGGSVQLVEGSNITLTSTGTSGAAVVTIASTASGGGTKTLARFTVRDNQPPAANFATLDTRNSISVLEFDAATEEAATFIGVIPEGANLASGLLVRLWWMGDTATSGNVRWAAAFERSGTDLDADSFDTATEVTSAANGTSGIETVAEVTCTAIDGLVAGERFRLRIARKAADVTNDTMTGDAQLVAVEVRGVA
jgi:hypothetical protein